MNGYLVGNNSKTYVVLHDAGAASFVTVNGVVTKTCSFLADMEGLPEEVALEVCEDMGYEVHE